ncbi:MAG: DUF4013 domain-containing protein [Methanomicrobiales archaeon]|nr:DUF4013 domain-containing protein [Methanomicrobiales archaeon]
MEYGTLLDDAFTYTKEGIFSNLNRWAALIVALICLGIPLNGYVMRIYRGAAPAPEVDQWGTLFIDGLKLIVVGLIYAIPMMIVWAFIYGGFFLGAIQGTMDSAAMESWEPDLYLTILLYAVEIIVGIFVPVAAIRFARTGQFTEAFNFGAILETIGKIGWIAYLIALIIITLVISIPIIILVIAFIVVGGFTLYAMNMSGIALLGLIGAFVLALLIISPLFTVFQARYMTKVYESAGISP